MKKITGLLLVTSLISCGKSEPLTTFGKGLETGFQQLGKTGEQIGRIPRIIGNKILGTDADSDENIKSLEKRVDELYKKFLENYTSLLSKINQVKNDLVQYEEDNDEVIDQLNEALNDLSDQVGNTNNNDLEDLNLQVVELNSIVECLSEAKNFKKAQRQCFN